MPYLNIRRDRSGQHGLTADEKRFALGTRSLADLVAPAALEVERDHVRLDYQYARALVVTGYPRSVGPGWLQPLIDFEEPMELSLHVLPLETGHMVSALTHKMVQLHSSRLLEARGGRLADPEREVAYEDAERLRDALQRGEEKVFSVGLYVLLRASSLATLDDLTRRVEVTLDGMLAHSRVAIFEQDAGFRSCLPEGQDYLLVSRNLDTSSLATTFPFSSSTLTMERGVLYGIAKHNASPVIFDPFDPSLENANAVVFAKSGAGKSYFTKLMALRNLLFGVDFLVIDPEDEYRTLCDAVGGQYVRLASSSAQHLNPFDLPPPDDDWEGRDPLAEQVAALLALLEIMLAEPGPPARLVRAGDPRPRALPDVRRQGHRAGPRDPRQAGAAHARPAGRARRRARRDRRPISPPGSSATSAAPWPASSPAPTNVALDRRFVVFNVQALEPELRPLGIHLITDFVWNQVRRSRRPRLLIIDEAWSLMQYAEGGAFLAAHGPTSAQVLPRPGHDHPGRRRLPGRRPRPDRAGERGDQAAHEAGRLHDPARGRRLPALRRRAAVPAGGRQGRGAVLRARQPRRDQGRGQPGRAPPGHDGAARARRAVGCTTARRSTSSRSTCFGRSRRAAASVRRGGVR